MPGMNEVVNFFLDLFRDERAAQDFRSNPEQALASAGLAAASPDQLQTTAVAAGVAIGGGDPVAGWQTAISDHWVARDPYFPPAPAPVAPAEFVSAPNVLSPTTTINNDPSFDFRMGDVTLGDKTTAQGAGAVAIGGSNHGDIVSGDGAVLGNANTVNSGNVHAGAGANVAAGHGNTINQGNTVAGGDVVSSHGGSVIQTSGHSTTAVSDGNTTNVHGSQTITDVHGAGNTTAVDSGTHVLDTSTTDNSVHDSTDASVHSTSVFDSSVHDNSLHTTAVTDNSVHDNSIHQTTHQNTGIDTHLGM